jgi:hypothetical protein
MKPNLFVDDIQSRLVDQANVDPLLSAPQNSIQRSVQHFSEGDDVTSRSFDDDFILSWNELVVALKEFLPISVENPGHLGTSREDEAYTLLEEDVLNDSNHLSRIGGEVESRLRVRKAVVGEEVVDTLSEVSWRM